MVLAPYSSCGSAASLSASSAPSSWASAACWRETAGVGHLAETALRECYLRLHAVGGAVVLGREIVERRAIEAAAASGRLARFEPAQALDRDAQPDDPLFPVRIGLDAYDAADRGWLLLGPRPDGSLYSREEQQAVRQVAGPIARALAVATQREHVQTALVGRLEQYADRVQQLEARLAESLRAGAQGLQAKPA